MTDTATVRAGRERLRRVTGVIALLSGIALVVGWFSDWPYMPMLWLWFAFWMAFGHWFFCRSLWVTQRHVRMIDYLYLGAAAVSIDYRRTSRAIPYARAGAARLGRAVQSARAGLRR